MSALWIVGIMLLSILAGYQVGRIAGWRKGWRDGLDFYDDQFGGHPRLLEALIRSDNERAAIAARRG